jgi:hypothetical protein
MILRNSRLKVGGLKYRQAQDPVEETVTEEELVHELEQSPESNWEEYLQVIIRELQTVHGTDVTLIGPELEAPYGSAASGFNIKGFLVFPEGRPLSVLDRFGSAPIVFRAYIADGELVSPITLNLS